MTGLNSLSVTRGCTTRRRGRMQENELQSDNNRSRNEILVSAEAAHTVRCFWRKYSTVFDKNNLSRCQQNKGVLSVIVCQFCSASVWLKMWVHTLFLQGELQKKCPLSFFGFGWLEVHRQKNLVKNLKIQTQAVWSTDRSILGDHNYESIWWVMLVWADGCPSVSPAGKTQLIT